MPADTTSDTPRLPMVPFEDDEDTLKTRLVDPLSQAGTPQELPLPESLVGKGANSVDGEGEGGYVWKSDTLTPSNTDSVKTLDCLDVESRVEACESLGVAFGVMVEGEATIVDEALRT